MKKNIIIFIILALFCGFILGYLGGEALEKKFLPQTEVKIKRTFVQELRGKGILLPEPEEIKEVGGIVESVSQSQLIVLVEQRADDP